MLHAALNRVQDTDDPDDPAEPAGSSALAFADRLAAALVARVVESPTDPTLRYWRFHEHRADPPELDPGVGWMQGPSAPRLGLPDDWWMVRPARTAAGRPRPARPSVC